MVGRPIVCSACRINHILDIDKLKLLYHTLREAYGILLLCMNVTAQD